MSIKSKFARRSVLALAVAATSFVALPTVSANASTVTHLSVVAKGKFEGVGMGAAKGSVTARFTLNSTKNTVCYSITTHGISGITGVHIHTGAAGVNGGVAVALDPTKINVRGLNCIAVDAKTLAAITAAPSMYYFNAHTAKFPNGAVRGQLK